MTLKSKSSLRTLLISLLLAAHSAEVIACSCFPPELRAKTAQEALEKSRLAVFGRVVEVEAGGKARLLVLESFKGPAGGAIVETGAGAAQCAGTSFTPGEEVLIVAFDDSEAGCNKYAPSHFLLEGMRVNAANPK